VVSVAASIAEGEGRGRARELARHLRIALGSLAEVDTLIRIGVRLAYLQAAFRTSRRIAPGRSPHLASLVCSRDRQ
jgi:four helix bundle protein